MATNRIRSKRYPGIWYRQGEGKNRLYYVWWKGNFIAAGDRQQYALALQANLIANEDDSPDEDLLAFTKRGPRTLNGGIYFVQGVDGGPIKIGWSKRNPEGRLAGLQCGSPVKLEIIAWIPSARGLEAALHRRLSEFRLHSEWFEPCEELFDVLEQLQSGLDLPKLARLGV